MENLLARHRNVTILVAVLFAEVIGLAVQVKRTSDTDSTRLIRVWTVGAVTPLEKAFVYTQQTLHDTWHNYFYLRGVRAENRALQDEIQRLRLEQVRVTEDAAQARRLQRLLGFKEQFISQTVAAQVIGSSGTDLSHTVYIDKGAKDGIRTDMAVMNADGIVGKVLRVFSNSSQVLLINDTTSGVGAILDKSRLQGVLKGSAAGETVLEKVMSDEQVESGEKVLTSGGDRIFPKGLTIGTVSRVTSGSDLFLNIRVKPAANLSRVEEVLVITKVDERQPTVTEAETPVRAIDILAARLPSVPVKPAEPSNSSPAGTSSAKPTSEPASTNASQAKPGTTAGSNSRTTKPTATMPQAAVSKPDKTANLNKVAAEPATTQPNQPLPAAEQANKDVSGETSAAPSAASTDAREQKPAQNSNQAPQSRSEENPQ